MTRGGFLAGGLVHTVDGLEIDNPSTASWCKLGGEDYRRRRSTWIRSVIIHTTKGIYPQHAIPGAGPGGKDEDVANYWRLSGEGKKRQSAAPLVVDTDGTVGCLADLVSTCAYHAGLSNDFSIGIEMYQLSDGGIYEATLAATVRLVRVLCDLLSIPFQIPHAYRGPLYRMLPGGKDCVGVFGHRENTHDRGRGDPGDHIFAELELEGAERLDFERGEDIEAWSRRQRKLNAMGETLTVDGLAGPGTMRALRRHGFASGRELDAAVEAQ
jgi:hypothetical protein